MPPRPARRNQGSVGIVGAGIFGVTAALELSNIGVAVTLYERRADILNGTSARNFFRLHRGYHYPRDPGTARQARDGYESFSRLFAEALVPATPHYYAIAAAGSRTTAEQFQRHCDQLGLRARPVRLPTLVPDPAEACFEVDESYYDAAQLKRLSWERLVKSHVQVELGCTRHARALRQAHDVVVVTAYGSLNQVLAELDCPTMELQYEVCEIPVIHASRLHRCSVVVLDGPFMSVAPYGTGLHLLYDVIHSVHTRTVSHASPDLRGYAYQLGGPLVSPPAYTRFASILSSAQRFVTPLVDVRHVGSLFAERIVLPGVGETDARPTEVRWVAPCVISVLSGKVSVAIDAARTVAEAIAGKLGLPGSGPSSGHAQSQLRSGGRCSRLVAESSRRREHGLNAGIVRIFNTWAQTGTVINAAGQPSTSATTQPSG